MARRRKIFRGLTGILLFAVAVSCKNCNADGFEISYKPFEVDEHTVALWHFDEGEGVFAKDATGRFVLFLQGENPWGEKGIFGKCLDLNGKDEFGYIEFPQQIGKEKALNLTGVFTMEAWINPRSLPEGKWGVNQIAGRIQGDILDSRAYSLNILNATPLEGVQKQELRLFVSSDGSAQPWDGVSGYATVNSKTVLQKNRWTHVAAVFEPGKSMRVYINGELAGERKGEDAVPNTVFPGRAFFTVGAGYLQNKIGYPFDGLIDELRISDIARY